VAQTVARGDLGSRIEVRGKDETSHLLSALRDMNGRLTEIVDKVRDSSGSIAGAARQIAAGNIDLSQRTEAQASSLQQTAASMEELTSTVKQNADNAQQATTLAANASEVAHKGSTVVGQVVSTMQDISERSSKIADITGIIEGIAFQTNILALNAAVEAARAGEQGRGFAVVASEVRSLAQRSSTAAKEIKELITSSVERVRDGATLAGEAGHTMTEVTQAVARVTDIMEEIAAASAEQRRRNRCRTRGRNSTRRWRSSASSRTPRTPKPRRFLRTATRPAMGMSRAFFFGVAPLRCAPHDLRSAVVHDVRHIAGPLRATHSGLAPPER
jgi:methyl-accepting chemotaxis protein-1 (serine sensor receptor)